MKKFKLHPQCRILVLLRGSFKISDGNPHLVFIGVPQPPSPPPPRYAERERERALKLTPP